MEHRDQDQIEPCSSCEAKVATMAARHAAEEPRIDIGQEDEEVARRALIERMKRKHPTRPVPRWFDAGEIMMVAACAAAIGGDVEAKTLAQRDAIAGAFLVSKDGPPTVRFIWEKLDHFFDHVQRGRRRRLAEECAIRQGQNLEPLSAVTRLPSPTITSEQIGADLERIFGPRWRTHVPRPSLPIHERQ